MSKKSLLLRILLSALLCLNGGTALWASTGMALDPSHMSEDRHVHDAGRVAGDAHAGHAHTTADDTATVDDTAAHDGHRHVGNDCDCGAGMIAGCACSCAYPAGFAAMSVPFAAQHARPAAAAAYVEIHAPLRGTGSIFRPPIG